MTWTKEMTVRTREKGNVNENWMLEHQKRPNKTRKGHPKPNKPRKNGSLVPSRNGHIL